MCRAVSGWSSRCGLPAHLSVCPSVGCLASFQDPSLELGQAPSLLGFPQGGSWPGAAGSLGDLRLCSCSLTGVPQSAQGFGSRVTDSPRLGFSAFPAAGLCNACLRCRARADRPGAGGSLGECDRAPPHSPGCGELRGGEVVLPGPALAVWREVTAGGGGRWPRPAAGLFVARRLLHKQQ